MGADRAEDDAEYLLSRILSHGKLEIERATLTRICRRFQTSEDMNPAIDVLIERHFLRVEETPIGYNNRKATKYFLNPCIQGNDASDTSDGV